MSTEPEAVNLYQIVGEVVGGALLVLGIVAREFFKGRSEGASELHGKQIVLEQAELADLTHIKALGEKLERSLANEDYRRRRLDDADEKLDEMLVVLRRLDKDADVAKQVREELRARRHGDGDRERR